MMNEQNPKPVFEVLANEIKSLGVEIVFGLMSDDTAQLCATLDAIGVRFVGARHENQAISMADGFAAATGKVGVALVGRGPAFANGFNGLTYAKVTANPVLVMYGDAPANAGQANVSGPDYKAVGVNQGDVLNAASIRTFVTDTPDGAQSRLREAFAFAQGNRLSVLLMPTDVQNMSVVPVESKQEQVTTPVGAVSRDAAAAHSIRLAADILADKKRPIIVAGRGAVRADAKDEIVALAEKTGAMLMTSVLGKDWFRGHPFNLGVMGTFVTSLGRRFLAEADCILVIGASLNALTMDFGDVFGDIPVIHLDADRHAIGRWTAIDIALVGDAKKTVQALIEQVSDNLDAPQHSESALQLVRDFDQAKDFEPMNTQRTLDARVVGQILNRILPKKRNLVFDGGNYMSCIPYIDVEHPGDFKLTTETYSIGLGFGNAIGFAAGRPDETTMLMIGDGAFLMTMGEMETVLREGIPLVIVAMNDCAYGSEVHVLRQHGMPIALAQFPDIDLATLAETLGYDAHIVRTQEQLEALADVVSQADEPVFIEIKTNPEVALASTDKMVSHD
ncbi:hypothetical protein AB838_08555 [Rhodobacteraceae bacterium (ex Bugula neritina AB1)]|nr:hypothetical protein AB838_08555 [Rhodobacteraceae bacterium (ex Bugula neritina AB1)]